MQTDTWITLAEADVLAYVNNAELTTVLTASLANGQAAPLSVILPDVTMEVRGYCRVRNTLGPAGTIPQELKTAAIDIVLYRVFKRIRKTAAAKEAKPDYDDAMKKMERVASGELKISVPLTPTTDVTSAPGPSFECPPRHGFGYEEERGI